GGGLGDAVLDVQPRAVVVQRDAGGDAGAALQPALDQEAYADARESLAARRLELGLAEGEVGGGAQRVGRRVGPQGAVRTAADVHELVQPRPARGPHALLAVAGGERADSAARRIEHDVKAPGLRLHGGAVVLRRVRGPLALR